jgi:hypothetical protein
MTSWSFAMLAVGLCASLGACRSSDRADLSEHAAECAANSSRVIVRVECGELHRVDTRWDVTTTLVKANGESCTTCIDVPPDSTAAEIAFSIARAIEAVCGVEAEVTPDSEVSRSIELTNATFGEIRLRKYGTELIVSPEGDMRVFHRNPVPIDDQFTIRKVR